MTVTMATNVIKANKDKSSDEVRNYQAPRGVIVSAFRSKPVSDLKAMFDRAGDKTGLSERSANSTKEKFTASLPRKIVTKPEGSNHVASYQGASHQASHQGSSQMASLNTAPAAVLKKGNNILTNNKIAFKDLSLNIKTDGIEKLASKPVSMDMVNEAILKTCNSGHTCKTFVEPKNINYANNCGDKTKTNAASVISLGLTKLHTRPKVTKDETNLYQVLSVEKVAASVKSGIAQPGLSGIKKNEKYVALHGVAIGWQSNVVKGKEHDSVASKKPESSVGKIREQVKTASDSTIPGFRSIGPENVGWNASDESSGSSFSNLSQRCIGVSSFVGDGEASTSKCENKTDVNANIQRFENIGKTNFLTVKLKSCNNGKKTENDLNSLDRMVAADSKSNFKQKGLKPFITKSNSSGIRYQGSDIRDQISGIRYQGSDKYDFNEPALDTQKNVEKCLIASSNIQEMKHSKFSVSSKLCTEKFQLLKKEFEINAAKKMSQSSTTKNLEKADIVVGISILERKQSFVKAEVQKQKLLEWKENISPRDTTVTETIKALNELDAKSKSEQMILCCQSQSLPSASQEDVSVKAKEEMHSLSGNSSGPTHLVVSADRNLDCSSDRDISSEADLIYEVIQGGKEKDAVVLQKVFTDGIGAFQKRRNSGEELTKLAEFQTGTDSDIDSDTEGSCSSRIYEHIDQQLFQNDVILDSASLEEELVQSRDSIKGKKKDKKGIKDRFIKLYKGKNMDTKTKVKQVNESGMPASPQFGRSVTQNLQKTNSSLRSNLDSASNINIDINSEGPDTEIFDTEQNLKKLGSEKSDEVSSEAPAIPPPLPPRHSWTNRIPSGGEMYKQSNASESASHLSVPPAEAVPRPLSSPNLERKSDRSSPLPLPPRNRVLNKLDLNAVIPVHPGGDRRSTTHAPSKDSYLHGQLFEHPSSDNAYTNDASDSCSVMSKDAAAPLLPTRPISGARKPKSGVGSCMDLDETVPKPPSSNGMRVHYYSEIESPEADEISKEPEKHPVSSSYMNFLDLTAFPTPGGGRLSNTPLEDMSDFYAQYNDDCPYMDLNDEQIYGTGQRYTSTLESSSLYQFYNKDKISRAKQRNTIYSSLEEFDEEVDSDKEERVHEDLSKLDTGQKDLSIGTKVEEIDRTAKVSSLEMFANTGTILRALWSDMPAVKNSGFLENITPQERKLQESMFEIITSEATYLKSLNVLMDMFVLSEEFICNVSSPKCVVTKLQQHVIFSNIGVIRDTSERLLTKLESRWQESVLLTDVCDIIAEFSARDFECYVHYCSNQVFQDREVTSLKKKPEFMEALKRIEAKPECQGLPMISFLLLPMQRITRLPLLVDVICRRLDPEKDKQRRMSALKAFHIISKVVRRCNNGAKKMQQTEQMYFVSKQIEFSANKEVAQIPLLSASRYLVKQGELVRITNETGSRIPFGKAKHGKQMVNVFLFSDLLVITKKKGDKFVVCDHAQRNSLHVEELNSPDMISRVLPLGVPGGCKYIFRLVMLENHDKKQVENVFACNSECDRTRWVDAFTAVKVTDDQRIYEEWDCPQVLCIKKYVACEPDELSLEESDIVNVYKKLEDDGMFEGERIRDGERGWFPKDHTVEIENAHVRARNMRMKYRLLSAADTGSKT